MEKTIIATKSGKMNMGGYSKNKTIEVYTFTFDFNGVKEEGKYFRFKIVGDSCDECFETLSEAMGKFKKVSKQLF